MKAKSCPAAHGRVRILALAFFTLALAVATAPAATNCLAPPSGIVGWWPGNGNADDLVSGNNGTLVDVTFTNGVDGEAFVFDLAQNPGSGFTGVRIPDQPAYALTNSLSIEGWVRPTGAGYVIFWRGDNRTGLDPYSLVMQGNNIVAFSITDPNNQSVSIFATLAYNQWWHLAATLDGGTGTMSLYTNGVLAAQTNTTVRPLGSLVAADSPGIGIGNINDGANNFPFTGDINQISLYNRALGQAEIQGIYNAGAAGKCPVVTIPQTSLIRAVIPTFSDLVTGASYQLQVSGDLQKWTNSGPVFMATNSTTVYPQYFNVDNWNELYFRLQVAP